MADKLPELETWLTMAQAAEKLNVHPTTLRRWAENGELPFMRTPGGHRRFAANDILEFAERRRRLRRVSDLEELWAQQALTQTRREIVQRPQQAWLVSMNDKLREENRSLGRRLLGLILQYIASEKTNGRIVAEARKLGQEYARLGMEMGLSLTAALEASMFFRDSLVETALQLPETAQVQTETTLRLMRRVNALLNAVHLAIAEAYDSPLPTSGERKP